MKPVRDKPQSIEEIINSFEIYALGDIEYTKSRPIAAFILSICFIEQLSTFLYGVHVDPAKRPELFFSDYMREYHGINLYHKARHTLVHNYSSRGNFDIDNVGNEDVPYRKDDSGTIYINTNVFIYYLKNAFLKAVEYLKTKESEQEKNALECSLYYPVLTSAKG